MSKTVIIGGVAGGASCAARLRRLDESMEIVLLERGEYISYANCGLPYYVGGVIKSRDALLLQTPEAMKAKYNIDVRVKNEVLSIDRGGKTVTIRRVDSGETYTESYDKLLISTGSSPLRPPIPGIDSPRILTLWTVPDTDLIRALIHEQNVKTAAVIGGGFIGLETAENLRHAGLDVSIIEMQSQVMAPLDYEMAQLLHENILQNGVNLYLNDGVDSFSDEGNSVNIKLKSGKLVSAELVILSIGVRPNGELAKAAGLDTNARGGIITDEYLRTSDPDIYAVGDVIEVEDFIYKDRAMVALAGPANKQGRIAANNIAGANEIYNGTLGTSAAKVFDLTAASTGSNEKTLRKRELVKGKDYESIIITQNSHAGYYPGALPLTIKLLFSPDSGKILGAQIVGIEGVDKRIDTIAATVRLGGDVEDLKQLELAYAPPYSLAKDPVNMAGFTAENVMSGKVKFAEWDAIETNPDAIVLDVREEAELMAYSLQSFVNIPLGQLRGRLSELEKYKEKKIIVLCAIGVRAYNACRILVQNGYENVFLYPSGVGFYRSTHIEAEGIKTALYTPVTDSGNLKEGAEPMPAQRKLDCTGLQCPGPLMQVLEIINTMGEGETLEVSASDPGFARDIVAWCKSTGNTLLSNERRGDDYVAVIKKCGEKNLTQVSELPQGKTIVVFSGDLDKVLASFVIANGAAAMGRPVTMFFTFWGLMALRRPEKQKLKKTAVEAMFGSTLPRGSEKLGLSRMNMGGLGASMMKKIMKDKNVYSLETLISKAMQSGVKIIACTMSMDVMGIKPEELIDGVELGGVGTYLGHAEESNVNLFI